ncbi:class A beta-lactamase, subclass A2 [Chitinophaga polysaccharea]|uniref:class A beta-lactamase, subclass A2 n=1 Tax=Chitinophaga TaxID=79328 RepID=UPI001455C0CC|nr:MULTISPECIES: class A beta-lactamase, subclass A2 [Chitinophaga]NLR59416.1 class A beta-lactamase, subclass A2 [Chitinophaga polysaccharea]NLU96050.1 class A beta-lactamase, subclass A2 [Chitinophaga sp. Ak27]
MKKHYIFSVAATIACLNGFAQAGNRHTTLRQQIADIAGNISGKVGVYAQLLETNDTVSFNRDQHFPMQSVYKFPVSMAVLQQVDAGKVGLDQPVRINKADLTTAGVSPLRDKYPDGNVSLTVRELLDYNVRKSDGSACDILFKLLGGPEKVNAYVHGLGIRSINIATLEEAQVHKDNLQVQYRNWSTPAAMVQLLKKFFQDPVLSDSSKEHLLYLMTTSGPGAKRLKGLLPEGTTVAHKTGTSWTVDGITAANNDVGIVTLPNGTHMAIAVFVSDSKANDEERDAAIAKIAKAVWDSWK